ncbi:MAG: DUF427 domain-containing protein [Myxococcota bacterium]
MSKLPRFIERARAQWDYTGASRPSFAEATRVGEESVWDYPRPPAVRGDSRHVEIRLGDIIVASSRRAVRLLETASPPTFYIPEEDMNFDVIKKSPSAATSFCEWKGAAEYFDVLGADKRLSGVLWRYPEPLPEYQALAGHFSAYPSQLECEVDGLRVTPQPGGFYGGWITPEVVGPFKGAPGSGGW